MPAKKCGRKERTGEKKKITIFQKPNAEINLEGNHQWVLLSISEDFLGGIVDYNLPTWCREQGFDPWSRKIHMPLEQLRLCTTTFEPML